MNVLIFGITGTLGNAMFNVLSKEGQLNVYGASRRPINSPYIKNIISNIDADNHDSVIEAFFLAKPDVVINCIGLIKQLNAANDPLRVLPINSMLPHRLAKLAILTGARFIHYSTDCVFSGKKGNYTEGDTPDCEDLYGRSKIIGEVYFPNSLTLRTSLIGHELNSKHSLIEWFLAQTSEVKGYTKAIFSGLTAYEHSKIIRDVILPDIKLNGLYHLAADPINKYDLLKLVAEIYGKNINIIPVSLPKVDRSLDAGKFYKATNYKPANWRTLITEMYNFNKEQQNV